MYTTLLRPLRQSFRRRFWSRDEIDFISTHLGYLGCCRHASALNLIYFRPLCRCKFGEVLTRITRTPDSGVSVRPNFHLPTASASERHQRQNGRIHAPRRWLPGSEEFRSKQAGDRWSAHAAFQEGPGVAVRPGERHLHGARDSMGIVLECPEGCLLPP